MNSSRLENRIRNKVTPVFEGIVKKHRLPIRVVTFISSTPLVPSLESTSHSKRQIKSFASTDILGSSGNFRHVFQLTIWHNTETLGYYEKILDMKKIRESIIIPYDRPSLDRQNKMEDTQSASHTGLPQETTNRILFHSPS